jgi:uncharacterized protein with von Willebrand factor type A (vWA) domain
MDVTTYREKWEKRELRETERRDEKEREREREKEEMVSEMRGFFRSRKMDRKGKKDLSKADPQKPPVEK